MWSGPELRDLDVFLTLAGELHFGRTAERLRMTPSRVSQIIRGLERKVGGALFERTSRRVRLTPLGERFADNLAPAYQQIHRAYADAQEVATGVAGTLRLGMYSPVNGGPHLLEILEAFHERYPGCLVQLVETDLARDQLDWLRRGDVDCLATRLPLHDPDLSVGPVLSHEQRVLLVGKDHPLARRRSISYDDVAAYAVPAALPTLPIEMMDAFIPPVTPSGTRLRRAEVHSVAEALMRVLTGEIVHPTVRSVLEQYPNPGVKAVRIRDLPASETALVWLNSNESAKVRALARTADEVLGSLERKSKRGSGHPPIDRLLKGGATVRSRAPRTPTRRRSPGPVERS